MGTTDNQLLTDLMRIPWVVIGAASVLVLLAPLVEEALKGAGVLLLSYRKPTRAQAFLWGVMGGAGFALVEGLFSGLLGLQSWGLSLTMRAAVTVIHAAGGGLTGLGWQALMVQRRAGRFLLFYLAAVILHGLWNGAAGGITYLGLRMAGNSMEGHTIFNTGLVTILLVALLGISWLVAVAILLYFSGRLARDMPPSTSLSEQVSLI